VCVFVSGVFMDVCFLCVRALITVCFCVCRVCVCCYVCVFCERDFGVSFVFIRLFSCARLNFGVYVLVVWVSACLFAMLVCMCVFL